MAAILHAGKRSLGGAAQLGVAERRRPDRRCAVLPVTLPKDVRVNTCGDRAGDVKDEVRELERSCQADHDEHSPRPEELGHTPEASFRTHMMECSHRGDQVKAGGREWMREKIATDVLDPFATLGARSLNRGRTATLNDLFFNPRAPMSRAELRERTTVHFLPYADSDLFIGGRTPGERGAVDLTVELSDWGMSVRQQRRVAPVLTAALAELFEVPTAQIDGINIRFHPYPSTNFAVGGRLLADLVPAIGRLLKRLS
jgi:hypothetical protein